MIYTSEFTVNLDMLQKCHEPKRLLDHMNREAEAKLGIEIAKRIPVVEIEEDPERKPYYKEEERYRIQVEAFKVEDINECFKGVLNIITDPMERYLVGVKLRELRSK